MHKEKSRKDGIVTLLQVLNLNAVLNYSIVWLLKNTDTYSIADISSEIIMKLKLKFPKHLLVWLLKKSSSYVHILLATWSSVPILR